MQTGQLLPSMNPRLSAMFMKSAELYNIRGEATAECKSYCARTQSLVHGQPLEITISQHVDAKQLSHPPKWSQQ